MAAYSEAEALTVPMATGTTETIDFAGLTPYAEGFHEIVFSANAADDEYVENNSKSVTIGIDSVYAHDDGTIGFAYGSVGFAFLFGVTFDIVVEDDLTATQIYLAETAPIGFEFSVSVHPVTVDGATVDLGAAVWESEDLFVTEEMRDAWTTVSLETPETLPVGKYAVMSNEHGAGSLELGFDANPLGDMIFIVNDNIQYLYDETFGYPMLRMVFGNTDFTSSINDVEKVEVSLYPNPTTGIVNIKNAQNQDVAVYNVLGKKVAEINNATRLETINLSNYAAGTYIVKVGTSVHKINKIN